MQLRMYPVRPVLLVFGALLALAAIAPAAVGATGLSVSTAAGADGRTVFTLSGNGFGPLEPITITGYTDTGALVTFPGTTANSIGAFQTALPIAANVRRLQATGQLSGITALEDVGAIGYTPPGFLPPYPRLPACAYYEGGYYWSTCAPAAVVPGYGLVPAAPLTPPTTPANPAATTVQIGNPVTFPVSGLNANEAVTVTLAYPDGRTMAGPGATADASGNANITVSFPSAGLWTVTVKGTASGKQGSTQFNVVP